MRVGDVVDVRLTLIVPKTRHFVVLADPYPSGLTPATGREPGENPGWRGTGSVTGLQDPFDRRAFRDERAVFFAQEMAAGTYQVTYRLRATVPGTYNVLPAVVSEMYFPEVRGRSGGQTIVVVPFAP